MLGWLNPVVAVLTATVPVLLSIVGLIRYRMRLKFLREVYNRAGDRRDLEIAGRITEQTLWTTRAHRLGRRGTGVSS